MAVKVLYSWYKRPVYEREVDLGEPTKVEQGYLKTKELVQRFQMAGEKYASWKAGTYDFEDGLE